MAKEKDIKRKAKLADKALAESFKFQVWYGRNQKAQDIPDDSTFVLAEIDTVCNFGLEKDLLTLRDIVTNVEKECGIKPVSDKGTLKGSMIAFLLGITQVNPIEAQCVDLCLADPANVILPCQIEIYFDNDVRNKVVDWVKGHYDGVTTRLGQPVLKLDKSVIHFKRLIIKYEQIARNIRYCYWQSRATERWLCHL